MGSVRGSINGYRCDVCGQHAYVVHVDDGVTPMFLACRATAGCTGRSVSLMYPSAPAPQHVLSAVAWEWFKRMDGLELRPLTDAGRELLVDPWERVESEGASEQ